MFLACMAFNAHSIETELSSYYLTSCPRGLSTLYNQEDALGSWSCIWEVRAQNSCYS